MDTRTDRIVELTEEQYAALKQQEADDLKDVQRRMLEIEGKEIPRPAPVNIPLTPRQRETKKIGRNEPCPCGSGIKYKKCCRGK